MRTMFFRLATVTSLVALIAGCSTMNQEECIRADWRLIGEADASKGLHSSVLDEYREDCAEYAIVPDRDQYFLGFDRGLERFCTRSRGFYFGKEGGNYRGTCPAEKEPAFLLGYEPGHELFMIEDRLNEIRTGLRDGERKIYQLRETIERKERQMVKESDEGKRKRLLSEIKEHNREIFWIKQDMTDSQFDLHFQELEYGRKLRLYSQ